MRITKATIRHFKCIRHLDMDLGGQPGWHVLLGENGAGKSAFIKAVAATFIGPVDVMRLDPDLDAWVSRGEEGTEIELQLARDPDYDARTGKSGGRGGVKNVRDISCKLSITKNKESEKWQLEDASDVKKRGILPKYYLWGGAPGWFSAAFGPFRRFKGGDPTLQEMFIRSPRIGAHLTAFESGVALTEPIIWLKDRLLRYGAEDKAIQTLRYFVNQAQLLPEGYALKDINADGVFFSSPANSRVHLNELSEGLQSVCSLAFELFRLLIAEYGAEKVLDSSQDNARIRVPGVVMIDEIDAHLHPSWQTRIGRWFKENFPEIQFIVTTHSAFACRHADSVWLLDNSEGLSTLRRIGDGDLRQLQYGNVLDAYGLGVFGAVTREAEASKMLERLAELNLLHYRDELDEAQSNERRKLIAIFPEHDTLLSPAT